MPTARIAVIGAGVAGLTAAVDLARQGFEVTVFERADRPGGKLREVSIETRAIDAGPTVFTLRRVFDELFDDAGASLEERVPLIPARVLARHAWHGSEPLDLYADIECSADAIGRFAGPHDADAFVEFAARAKRIFHTLDSTFMRAQRPSMLQLARRVGLERVGALWNIQPFTTLWKSAGRYFRDPRLQQLFARYATYCGSSPFESPATLMLVAHAEQAGVWYIEGGMYRLAEALAALARDQGANLRYGCGVEHIEVAHGRVSAIRTLSGERFAADAIVYNGDTNALASGMLGDAARRAIDPTRFSQRSLSAVTWNLLAQTSGFELAHHSVFFSSDYRREFEDIFTRQRLPVSPTVYVCAQDRYDDEVPLQRERLLCLINAPPIGDRHSFGDAEIEACETSVFQTLANFGLRVERRRESTVATSPTQFDRLFPATGGALYGPASHGWMASFKRTGARSKIPGLYLAGGSAHPGPGVPMAATSGRLAAAAILADRASIARSRTTAMSGGTSTR